uniref:Uncharacterized protein n=1 Tax=Arundo donax TaxID=35708 RepID=A0A0A9ASU6_ARUDO
MWHVTINSRFAVTLLSYCGEDSRVL